MLALFLLKNIKGEIFKGKNDNSWKIPACGKQFHLTELLKFMTFEVQRYLQCEQISPVSFEVNSEKQKRFSFLTYVPSKKMLKTTSMSPLSRKALSIFML